MERSVRVALAADTGQYGRSVDRATGKTNRLAKAAREFAGKSYTARAEVKTGDAQREIADLRQRLTRLDSKTARPTVKVNTDGAARNVSLIVDSIVGLGPAAVAAGAAGSAALLGLGSTIGSVAAGAGTAGLAFAGLGDAIGSMNDYAVDPTDANLASLREEMNKLSGAGRAFSRFISSEMQPVLTELQHTAQAGMLPGVANGLAELKAIAPQVTALIDETSRAMGQMAAEAGDALTDPFWRSYVGFLQQEAAPTLKSFGRIVGNLATGFAGAQMAFAPMARDVIGGLEDMSQAFKNWGATLDSDQGFQAFLDYARQVGPQVRDTLGALGDALGGLVEAAAPLGGPVLAAVEAFADAVAAIAESDVGTPLMAAAIGMVAVNRATSGMALLGRYATKLNAIGAAAGVAVYSVDRFTVSADKAAAVILQGGRAAGRMRKEFEQTNSTWQDWIGVIPVAGAWLRMLIDDEEDLNRELAEQRSKLSDVERAQLRYNKVVAEFGPFSQEAVIQSRQLAAITNRVELEQKQAAWATKSHTEKVKQLTSTILAGKYAFLGWEKSLDVATRTLKENGTTLDADTAAGRANQRAIYGMIEARDKHLQTLREQDAATGVVTMTARAHNAEIRETARQAGLTDQQIDRLTAGMLAVPDSVATPVSAPGAVGAKRELDAVTAAANGIPAVARVIVKATGGYSYSGNILDGPSAYASGGILPGYTPGRDVHHYSNGASSLSLSGGEAIMRPEWTRAVSPQYVDAANSAARSGGVSGVQQFIRRTAPREGAAEGREGDGSVFARGGIYRRTQGQGSGAAAPQGNPAPQGSQRFASGGVYDYAPDAVTAAYRDVLRRAGRDLAERYEDRYGRVLGFARSQAGKPYGWGQEGPGAYDCSGWISALVNVARGDYPHSRLGATGTFPWAGFRAGHGPGINVGSFRGSPGHMAATVAGVNTESSGGVGVRVGGGARGAAHPMFNTVAHVPFDEGGVLNGIGRFDKETLEPERVLSPRQTELFGRLVDTLDSRLTPRAVTVPGGAGAAGGAAAAPPALIGEQNNYAAEGTDTYEFADQVMFEIRASSRSGR